MSIKYSRWKICLILLSALQFNLVASNYRENLALRHPCNLINKRLEPYITWTEKLSNSQYKGKKDACDQYSSGPVCCTDEVVNSYASTLGVDLKALFDSELIHISRIFAVAKQQTDVWSREYLIESRRLTISSLETLFGTKEYRLNIHQSLTNLFSILGDSQSSVDDVSRSTNDLFNHLIISLYRRFMSNDNNFLLDEKHQKCLVNKAFDLKALSTQQELLYILTSGSILMKIFRTMLIYIDADIQRLRTTVTMNTNQCLQFYAKETLCPICIITSTSFNNQISKNSNIDELLCENDCQYIIKTCVNQTNNPYIVFASIAKGYATIVKDIELAIIELKLVERLSKLHIYFYDMVVNATNSRHIYTQLRAACPNPSSKSFSPILSLPPTINERRELVARWNRSLYFLFKQLHSSIDNLHTHFTQQIITDICSNSKYASKSNQCTQLDKQIINNFIDQQHPSIPEPTFNKENVELTRNQLDDLRKKMAPVQQMILSLRPKKKYSLIEYLPDFEGYDDDDDININDDHTQLPLSSEIYDNDIQDSLSERIYRELDGKTTRRSTITTRKLSKQKSTNNGQLITYSMKLYLIIFIHSFIKHNFAIK